jgi:protein required for attachment to host cells
MPVSMKENAMDPVNIPTNALVLVSDGRRARLLRNQGTPRQPQLIVEHSLEQVNPRTREQGTDQPGRKHGTDGNARSAIEQTDWHQRQEERFAAEIAEMLYKLGHAGGYEELVVVAPPKMLGDLRQKFHQEVKNSVVAEVPRDLTTYSVPEIGRLLLS